MDGRQTARCAAVALAWLCTGTLFGESANLAAGPSAAPELTRAEALRLAEIHNLRLAAAGAASAAAEGRAEQAGLRPNPEIEIEVEDLAGTRGSARFGEAVTTARVGQRLELGGKRAARRRVAELDTDLGRWDVRRQQAEVRQETAKAFTAVVAAQERLRLTQAAAALAQRLVETVSERVQAGKDAPLELSKANVAAASRGIAQQRAESALHNARLALAACWGAETPAFGHAAGELAAVPAVPELTSLLGALGTNPDLARGQTAAAQRSAALALARSGGVPDVTVGAGTAWSAAAGEATFLISLSMPLPLFDRNQGAIREARANLGQTTLEQRALETELRVALAAQYEDLKAAQQEARSLAEALLPEATRALEAAREAYTQGKAGHLDVLDAQQTLFEAQMQYVDALASCHDAAATVERLAGQALIE